MAFPHVKVWTIYASTGCTCCSSRNHERGPYSSLEFAQRRVKEFEKKPLLSSQYSKIGLYRIDEHDGEQLLDGRIISEDRVFQGFWDKNNSLDETLTSYWD